jgi:hypothetical protein
MDRSRGAGGIGTPLIKGGLRGDLSSIGSSVCVMQWTGVIGDGTLM